VGDIVAPFIVLQLGIGFLRLQRNRGFAALADGRFQTIKNKKVRTILGENKVLI
jgi:hypothetical protein